LTTIGNYWQLLATIGNYWQLLATIPRLSCQSTPLVCQKTGGVGGSRGYACGRFHPRTSCVFVDTYIYIYIYILYIKE
jgi:hypothetical protein